MTPKEKAKSLYHELTVSYWDEVHGFLTDTTETKSICKKCVEEIISELKRINVKYNYGFGETFEYWDNVLKEIDNL